MYAVTEIMVQLESMVQLVDSDREDWGELQSSMVQLLNFGAGFQ